MQIGDRIASIRASGTVRLAQEIRELKAQGKSIVDLTEGEPDFDTPEFVVRAASKAAFAGQTRYTAVAGTTQLREAICRKFKRDSSLDFGTENIVVGTGGKQLIFNALMISLNPGDEVIIPAPYWVSYPEIVKFAGGIPKIVHCSDKQGFKLLPEQLEEALSNRTRWIILNSPGNPTGSVYSASELASLANVIRKCPEVAVMCDDIYEKIVFDDVRFATMAEVAPDLSANILTINGVSKSYAMTGWRIGYAAGPADFVRTMIKLQGQSTTNASSVGQAAALAALDGTQDFLHKWRKRYQARRDLVHNRLSRVAQLELSQPQGAFYHFVGCRELFGLKTVEERTLTDDSEVVDYFIGVAGVGVVPGSEFGSPGYFRLCFAKSEDELESACDKIARAISQLRT